MTDPRYPIGKFHAPDSINAKERMRFLEAIALAPSRLRDAVSGLSSEQLDTQYRDGGWTIRQVVHHVPDSHMNAYIRFKLALTENDPVIKPYDEAAFGRLSDVADTPVEVSLSLLEFLHRRWVILMRGLSDADWQRCFVHPEFGKPQKLEQTLALYAWHSEHHLAHVRQALARSE